jgi:hypothetical protein
MKKTSAEFKRFDEALDTIMSVSHDELKRREEAWKKQRKAKGYKRVKA